MSFNLDRLRQLDEAATAGPWEQESGYLGDEPYCSIYVTKPDGEPQGLAEINDSIEAGQGNAELVTYLRNAVPAILAMAEENARMERALGGLHAAVNARAVRGRDHVPSMRDEQEAMVEAMRVLRALGKDQA